MSLTAAVRSSDSKIFHNIKGNQTSKENEMLVQQQFCINTEYFHLPTPSSSIDLSDNHHSKSSSSDSNSSRDEISDIPADVKFRLKEIPVLTCFNFDATNQDEISFKRGSKVYVKKNHFQDDQYVYIEFDNGKGGYAPKQFLQPVGNTPPIVDDDDIRRIAKIGEGSFSNVYKIEFKGSIFALKEFKESCFEKAKNEAECLNVMDHINIVKVFALCESPVSMLMEFCEGNQLVNLIRKRGFNPPVRILMNWASQIAEGLWHMHNQEIPICHGDIKPSNVMIKERPCVCNSSNYILENSDICSCCKLQRLSRLTLKLTDFGLARPISSNTRHSLVGSAPYMAPEYIREMKMTPAADVWSFGVLVWELLTKEAPYRDASPDEKAAIMWAIGKGLRLEIPKNCSREQKRLLECCWDNDDTNRPTMKQVIDMIKAMPKIDPDYVVVYESNQPSTKSLIDFLKTKFSVFNFPEKPSPPKRKGKHFSKNEIGTPSNFRTVLSVQHEDNDRFTIHDHEVDRQRHLSSHDNCEQATLPRNHKSSILGNSYRSTPDLNVEDEVKESKLERTNAVRRKHGSRGGDQSIVASCLPTLDDNSSTVTMSPICSSTPTVSSFSTMSVVENVESDGFFVSNTIEVVDDIVLDKISVPIRNKISQGSLKERRYSPKRSPSSNSNSTFYVSTNGDLVTTPTYDTSTIKSESSIESSASKKKGFLKNFGKHFKSKSQDQGNHDVCYDSGKYYKLANPRPNTEDFPIFELSPAVQIATIPISQLFTADAIPRFKKLQDSALSQRKKAIGHRRNQSNGSEKIMMTNKISPKTPPSTPPSFHQSMSEDSRTPSTPIYLSISNQTGSISPGSKSMLNTILPLSSSSSNTDFRFRTVSSSDLRSRAATTDLPREPEELAPFMHARSKSTDTRGIHEVNDNPFAKRFMQQRFVQNEGYFNVLKKSIEKEENTAEKPHYRQLKQHPPLPPTFEPPMRPPRNSNSISSINTIIEMPSTRRTPPPIPPRQIQSTSSNYLVPLSSRTTSISLSPTLPNTPSSESTLPKSTAPILRPDTLLLDNPRTNIRREHPYVHLSSNFRPDDYATTTKVPHIPRNIKRH